jgi:hypothetical protein
MLLLSSIFSAFQAITIPFKYEYEFLETKIIQQTSPEEAYRRFESMAVKQIDALRKLTKQVFLFTPVHHRWFFSAYVDSIINTNTTIKVQDNRKGNKDENVKRDLQEYDDNLEKLVGYSHRFFFLKCNF